MARVRIITFDAGWGNEYFLVHQKRVLQECSSSLKITIKEKRHLLQLDRERRNKQSYNQ